MLIRVTLVMHATVKRELDNICRQAAVEESKTVPVLRETQIPGTMICYWLGA